MVVDALIDWFVTFWSAVINLFPGADIDTGPIGLAWSELESLNYFLPIGETLSAVAAVIAVGPAFLVVTVVNWLVVGVVRGGNPRA